MIRSGRGGEIRKEIEFYDSSSDLVFILAVSTLFRRLLVISRVNVYGDSLPGESPPNRQLLIRACSHYCKVLLLISREDGDHRSAV
jgi:hypothetical protein